MFVEIISIHFKKDYTREIIIEDKRNGLKNLLPQGYIYHDKCWLIYRNSWFDEYIKGLKLGVNNLSIVQQIL